MLDRLALKLVARPLDALGGLLARTGLPASLVSLLGLGIGLGALPLLAQHQYKQALGLILLNRLLDGLDGALARHKGPSPYGAWLDIVCDMLFYGGIVFGMTLALPDHAFWSVLLLFSFMGTMASALAYAAVAPAQDERGLALAPGLIEGTETIAFFVAFCLMPFIYPTLAIAFSALCFLTVAIRFVTVARALGKGVGKGSRE